MAKAAFDKKKTFHQQIGLACSEEISEMPHWEHRALYGAETETFRNRLEGNGKF